MILSEVFGPTIAGEGPSMGRLAGFVRLGLCNEHCSWCDTPYTWDWTGRNGVMYSRADLLRVTPDEIAAKVRAMNVPLVVITGGEPMLQPLTPLARELAGHDIEVETNGTRPPTDELALLAWFNVSPKLANSGQDEAKTIRPDVLRRFHETGKARFKWVCCTVEDVEHVVALNEQIGLPAGATWIMPEGATRWARRANSQQIVETSIRYGFNVSGRLHVEWWGNERGH